MLNFCFFRFTNFFEPDNFGNNLLFNAPFCFEKWFSSTHERVIFYFFFLDYCPIRFFSSSQLLSSFKSRFKNCSFFVFWFWIKTKKRDDLTSFNEALGVAHSHLKLTWKEVNWDERSPFLLLLLLTFFGKKTSRSLSLSLTHTHQHSHTLSLSLSLTHTHTPSLSSLSGVQERTQRTVEEQLPVGKVVLAKTDYCKTIRKGRHCHSWFKITRLLSKVQHIKNYLIIISFYCNHNS